MSAEDCPDEVEEYDPADVEDPRFDLYKDDGWSNADLLHRNHLSEGEYLGPKDDPRDIEAERDAYMQANYDAPGPGYAER